MGILYEWGDGEKEGAPHGGGEGGKREGEKKWGERKCKLSQGKVRMVCRW